MPNNIVILGAGGHAKVIADIVLSCGDSIIGFLDDSATGSVMGYPILGTLRDISAFKDKCSFTIGIGNNSVRKQIAESNNVNWHTAVHPSAVLAREVSIGEGTVIMAGAIINTSARIGMHCIINTGVVVEHDNHIGDYAHISPNATLCGTVSIGNLTHIGAGAVVKNNISICDNCIIGAGAVVVNNLLDAATYVGLPACKFTGKPL